MANLFNTPGAVADAFLNGANGKTSGLLSPLNGLAKFLFMTTPTNIAKKIVTPGATNITTGGSLYTTFQNLGNQLVNGWPSLSGVLGTIANNLTTALQSLPSVIPQVLNGFVTGASAIAGTLGTLLINLLKML